MCEGSRGRERDTERREGEEVGGGAWEKKKAEVREKEREREGRDTEERHQAVTHSFF